MTKIDEDISKWIQIFIDANSSDQNASNIANEAINDKLNNAGEYLIKICDQLLVIPSPEDENTIKYKSLASKLLSDMLSVKNQVELDFNRKNLSPETIELTINTLKQVMYSSNPTIRSNCCKTYSNLLSTLTTTWFDGIDYLLTSFTNERISPQNYLSLILTLEEMVNQINFADEILKPFFPQFEQTLIICIDILSKSPTEKNYTAELRTETCKYITQLISTSPKILAKNDEKVYKIQELLYNLSNSYQIDDNDLFASLNRLLFILVKNFYTESSEFIEKVSEFVFLGLDEMHTNRLRANSSISFWKSVALHERCIVEIYSKSISKSSEIQPQNPLLIERIAPTLVPIMVKYIENIDENVKDDLENPEPRMFSITTIAAFYAIIPKVIFDMIKDKIDEKFNEENRKNWLKLLSGIFLIYSISNYPITRYTQDIIFKYFNFLIEGSSPENIQIYKETSLYLISLILQNYPDIFSIEKKFYGQIIDQINNNLRKLLEIEKLSKDDLLIGCRLCSIIFNYSNLSNNNLSLYFDNLYEVIQSLYKLALLNENQQLFKSSSIALSKIIMKIPIDINSKLIDIYSHLLDLIEKSSSFECKQDIIFMYQSYLLSGINAILLKLAELKIFDDTILENEKKTLSILLELLSQKNIYVYEIGLSSISSLTKANKKQNQNLFTPEIINKIIFDFVYNGLISNINSIIDSSCILIGNIYSNLLENNSFLLDLIPDIFNALRNIILTNNDCSPSALNALASIFYSIDKDTPQVQNLESQLFDLMNKIIDKSKNLDMTIKKDITFGNSFYRYLCDCAGAYARVYFDTSDFQKEREQLFFLSKLSNSVFLINPKIDDNLYLSIANAANMFAKNCSARNNVILNRHANHRLLRMGYENAHSNEIKRKIREIQEYLKSK